MTDTFNFYYLAVNDSLSSTGTINTLTLYKVASGIQTQLATAPIAVTVGPNTFGFTRGTFHRFRVSMLVGVMTIYVDGVMHITYTDGSPLSSGTLGLFNNGGTTGSRFYQLWMVQVGDYVSGTPAGDPSTGRYVYTRLRLATTDPSVTPQVEDITTSAYNPEIGAGISIPSVTYNATFINSNFDDLAKQSNYSWYISPNKHMVFKAPDTIASPWILQSNTAGLVVANDLEVNSDLELDVGNDLYRNRQTILGALGTFAALPVIFEGDGSARSFTLGYPVATLPTILRNGIAQTVGLKGTNTSNWYYAVDDPVLEQDSTGQVLQTTEQLEVTYTGLYAVTVTVDDVVEQTRVAGIEGGSGVVENVEDVTGQGMSLAAATTLAGQLINRYAIAGRTFIFDTSRDGLAIGQTLSIFLPEHGIWDGQFVINQVEITLEKGINDTQIWWYKVTCSELPRQASWAKLIASGLGLQ